MNTQTPLLAYLRYQNGRMEDSFESFSPTVRTILGHRSTRNFSSEPLAPNTLEILLAAGQSASTSSGLQTWSVIAISEPEHKAEVATLCGDQDFIRQAPLFLLFCADLSRLSKISEQEGLPGKGLEHMDMFLMATIDAALASQNVSLAAESMGYGICYVGAARNNARELSKLLRLPPRVIGLFGMAIGKADYSTPTSIKPRLDQHEILHRNFWDSDRQDEHVIAYNKTLGDFYESQGKVRKDSWSRHAAQKLASGNLDGREMLREVLEERDFQLK
ncbi:Nitro/flavin reductase [Aaosphaeria arxii CBS 175.79]|uniref:Nitro/flavin reductase n=1 Tax=Aaosphaeria arxii CBS 175.79 TaxID=1450172 RepID=A0A6A5XIF4_9PLEO|nr:Nitro/flavin reductase [Aaosphaeria arxii CBS 175.79]KAF2012902.1 Nitro/flavin reductase [Aaosphaeria arxii CBS 175.79]